MNQPETVAHFRQLHARRPLILPNAWDAASARVIEAVGAPAIATTGAGVSWSFGRADGQRLRREEMLQVIGNIVESVRVPVSADMESAYGNGSRKDVADTVQTSSHTLPMYHRLPAFTIPIFRTSAKRRGWSARARASEPITRKSS